MHDSRIFYLRLCFTLFINVRFSNAYVQRITNPRETFAYAALLHSLFVQEPDKNDLAQYLSTRQMFLGLHKDYITLSIYETDAPYTFLTFKQRQVDFELRYAQTMIFTVKDENGIWHFRCVFSANKDTLDVIYSYLGLCTGRGPMEFRMGIDRVDSYVQMDHMEDPSVETVEDLKPARLYDQPIGDSSNKIYSVAQSASKNASVTRSRLVFRTGNFELCVVNRVVVLKLAACPYCFHIFYFPNARRAEKFAECLAPYESLDLPFNVQSYVLNKYMNALMSSQNESKSDPEELRPENYDQPSQFQQTSHTISSLSVVSEEQPRLDEGVRVQAKSKDMARTTFTDQQLRRLRKEFDMKNFLTKERRRALAVDLDLTEDNVRIWFQNRRSLLKKSPQTSEGE